MIVLKKLLRNIPRMEDLKYAQIKHYINLESIPDVQAMQLTWNLNSQKSKGGVQEFEV